MDPFTEAEYRPDPTVTPESLVLALGKDPADPWELEKARASLARIEKEMRESSIYLNSTYQVVARTLPKTEHGFPVDLIHLSIKRRDREPIHDWRDLLAIKDAICSPCFDAVELYPAYDRVVDTSNQYHLWVFADASFRLPLGWFAGRWLNERSVGRSKQRPFEKGEGE